MKVASTKARPSSGRPSRRVLVVAGVLAVLAALLVTGVVVPAQRTDQVAAIDGGPVTRDELLFHMRRLAPRVQNELRNTYHLQSPADWNAKAGDRTALQRLAARALDQIGRDRAVLALAGEQGLPAAADHAGFLAELAAENERRSAAIAKGEVVYGLAEFSPEEFYSHRLTELATTLKQRLSANRDGPLHVTDAEVRKAFEQDRDAWSANATTYTYAKLVVPVPEGAAGDYAEKLRRRVAAADRLARVAEREPGAELSTDTRRGGGSAVHDQDLMAVLGALDPGQISAPVTGAGQITYYELTGKTVDEDAAFAEYARRIRQSLVEEKFDQFIRRRVDAGDVEIDATAVDAINAEDVQQ
ncbi:hypothetical protein AB0M50_22950 [Nonomuraea fuscirosea]|uniref:peptidyl-prolyl cis-trans isomerase n=1 Tax=Nonomuraea fuscirosea TaxID=1291556 RepID=UPI00341B3C0B